jgi:ParB/RepB/Spo0J family partition protein
MYTTKPTSWLHPDPNNPRKDEGDIEQLGNSMLLHGQIHAIVAKPDGTIIDGWRRWLAAQRKGIKELAVIISEKPLSETEVALIQGATAIHRADLSGWEKFKMCERLLKLNPTWTAKELAEKLSLGGSKELFQNNLSKF